MLDKRVIALSDFKCSDDITLFSKDSIISVLQEDPSGHYYYGRDEKNQVGWFLKSAVEDCNDTAKKIQNPIVTSGFMTKDQLDAFNMMQAPKKVNEVEFVHNKIPEVVQEAYPTIKKAAPGPPPDSYPTIKKAAPGPPPDSSPIIKKVAPVPPSDGVTTPKKSAPLSPVEFSQDLNNSSESNSTRKDMGSRDSLKINKSSESISQYSIQNPSQTQKPLVSAQPMVGAFYDVQANSVLKKKAPPAPGAPGELSKNSDTRSRNISTPPVPTQSTSEEIYELKKKPLTSDVSGNTKRKISAPPPTSMNWTNMDAINSLMPSLAASKVQNPEQQFSAISVHSEKVQGDFSSEHSSTLSSRDTTLSRQDQSSSRKQTGIQSNWSDANSTNTMKSDTRNRSDSSANTNTMSSARLRSDSSLKLKTRTASSGKQALQPMDMNELSSSSSLTIKQGGDDCLGPSVKNILALYDDNRTQSTRNPLDEYASRNFGSDEKGFTFQKVPIKRPMHKISDTNARKEALSGFEHILIYCGDANGNRYDAARSLVDISRNNLVSDEIICQLLKQTINNTSSVAESTVRSWALLCLVLVYSDPSLALKQVLIEHMKIVSRYEKPFDQLSKKCLENLHLAATETPRKMLPSNLEIISFETNKYCIPLKLDYPTGVSKSYNITPYTKGSDLLTQAAKYLSLPDYLDHGIAISIDNLEVLPLLPEEKILDVCAIIEKMIIDKDDKKVEATWEFFNRARFCVLRKVWLRVDPLLFNEMDEWELTQIYNEIRPNFISGAWLGQLQFQKEYLEVMCTLGATRALLEGKGESNYASYMPKPIVELYESSNKKDKKSVAIISQEFTQALENLRYVKPLQLRRDFIKVIHEWDLFGCRVYEVFFESDNRLAGDAFLAVRPGDVWFLDLERKAITTLKYPEIQKITLEQGGREVVIKTGTVAQQRVVRFQSKQSFAIQTA
eukprot:NODE_178_length_15814_cov_0.338657.p1 type:complete len:954 gc:universal NODE_178_length_15814_cov_0.338657:9133-11994(+)